MKVWTLRELCYRSHLCCDKVIDFAQSREGRKKIRKVLSPIFIVGSIFMIICGAVWTKYTHPICGENIQAAQFSIVLDPNTGERVLNGNSCPGYYWKDVNNPVPVGVYPYNFVVASNPRISTHRIFISSIQGPIGVAMNGIPIYSPAAPSTGYVDTCSGQNAPETQFAFSEPLAGYYHYKALPGLTSYNNGMFTFCPPSKLWYNQSSDAHSPLAGFMADGIPIYGPLSSGGTIPADLDECGGHASDDFRFYHYHFNIVAPYSPACLRGCADGSMNGAINSGYCSVNSSSKYDYSSLINLEIIYGGGGIGNRTDWTGPATLLAFGFFLFIPASLCCICALCSKKKRDHQALAFMDGYDSAQVAANPLHNDGELIDEENIL